MPIKVKVSRGAWRAIGAEKKAAARGLGLAADHLLGASRKVVPLEEGTLERSGTASVDRANLEAAVSYDGPYAVIQHERLDFRHDPGRTAKYLEGPAVEEGPAMSAIIAAELQRGIGS